MLLPLLLLLRTGVVVAAAAAVRHRVADGETCCWFIESDSLQCFLSLYSNTIDFCCMHSLAVRSHIWPRYAHTASSVITGMRGAKAGVSPPRRSPPCTSREVNEASQRHTCSRPCAFEEKRRTPPPTKSRRTKNTPRIHSSLATATTSRRRAMKHVQRVCQHSPDSIDPGFVEIGHSYSSRDQ